MPNAGGLTDREAAIDAIIRFVCSLDNGESELCASAFTEDVVVTLNFCKTDMHYDPSIRRDDVVDLMMKKVGKPLDTNHSTADNCCTVTGNSAELTTCVLAQPFQGGKAQARISKGPTSSAATTRQHWCEQGNCGESAHCRSRRPGLRETQAS